MTLFQVSSQGLRRCHRCRGGSDELFAQQSPNLLLAANRDDPMMRGISHPTLLLAEEPA